MITVRYVLGLDLPIDKKLELIDQLHPGYLKKRISNVPTPEEVLLQDTNEIRRKVTELTEYDGPMQFLSAVFILSYSDLLTDFLDSLTDEQFIQEINNLTNIKNDFMSRDCISVSLARREIKDPSIQFRNPSIFNPSVFGAEYINNGFFPPYDIGNPPFIVDNIDYTKEKAVMVLIDNLHLEGILDYGEIFDILDHSAAINSIDQEDFIDNLTDTNNITRTQNIIRKLVSLDIDCDELLKYILDNASYANDGEYYFGTIVWSIVSVCGLDIHDYQDLIDNISNPYVKEHIMAFYTEDI